MITREQAEQAFYERYSQPNSTVKPEVRNLQMEESDTDSWDMVVDIENATGQFEIEKQGWKCTFEIRYREIAMGKWTGLYTEWRKDTCYIVEPKPGPYVIE